MSTDVSWFVDSLVMQSPSGWWLRISDHDDVFYPTRDEAVAALIEILELYDYA